LPASPPGRQKAFSEQVEHSVFQRAGALSAAWACWRADELHGREATTCCAAGMVGFPDICPSPDATTQRR
jgi:hypothetical protein